VNSPLKKKGSRKTKPPLEKLPYKKSKEESKAVAQKDLDAFWKTIKDACEARRNLQKPQFALPR
jgi:Holliday junction resolvase RusA-like endonuclease